MRDEKCSRIYKYLRLSGPYGRMAVEQAVIHSQLFWQTPAHFNDPFDCIPVLYFGDNEVQRRRFRVRASAAANIGGPRAVRRQHRRSMDKVPLGYVEQQLRSAWGEWISSSAITCFSEVHDHPLMWGHYSDSHKGVCLVFDEIVNDQQEFFAFPVIYQEARPRVNLTQFNDPDVMMQALFLKSQHWAYEREQRMVGWKQAPGYRDFPPQSLQAVILGAKISEDDAAFVRGLLEKRARLRLFRAEIDAAEFRLNILPA